MDYLSSVGGGHKPKGPAKGSAMGRGSISRSVLAFACIIAAIAAASGLSRAAGRYEFRVVGVTAPDALNIRERPESQNNISTAKIVGRIPANASGIVGSGATRNVGGTRWFEVRYKDVRGWVNGKYLAPMSAKLDGELSANLFCAGAEPFWSLKVEQDKAELKRAEGEPERYSLAAREPFQGREGTLALRLVSDNGAVSALVQHKEWCSNGSSDVDYAFEVRAIGIAGDEKALRGCCMLQR
jgi:uncharacterized membrane protein